MSPCVQAFSLPLLNESYPPGGKISYSPEPLQCAFWNEWTQSAFR